MPTIAVKVTFTPFELTGYGSVSFTANPYSYSETLPDDSINHPGNFKLNFRENVAGDKIDVRLTGSYAPGSPDGNVGIVGLGYTSDDTFVGNENGYKQNYSITQHYLRGSYVEWHVGKIPEDPYGDVLTFTDTSTSVTTTPDGTTTTTDTTTFKYYEYIWIQIRYSKANDVLFTEKDDRVDFNHLTNKQKAAIEDGAKVNSALDGNDFVKLPNSEVIAEQYFGKNLFFIGSGGRDQIFGGKLNDKIDGGSGNDIVSGGSKKDYLSGGTGADELRGDDGDDRLSGGAENDKLFGGDDDDLLIGGIGNDFCDGGKGTDTAKLSGSGADYVISFVNPLVWKSSGQDGVDVLSVERFEFDKSAATGEQFFDQLLQKQHVTAYIKDLDRLVSRNDRVEEMISSARDLVQDADLAVTDASRAIWAKNLGDVIKSTLDVLNSFGLLAKPAALAYKTGYFLGQIGTYEYYEEIEGDRFDTYGKLLAQTYGFDILKKLGTKDDEKFIDLYKKVSDTSTYSLKDAYEAYTQAVSQARSIRDSLEYFEKSRDELATMIRKVELELRDHFAIGKDLPIIRLEGEGGKTPDIVDSLFDITQRDLRDAGLIKAGAAAKSFTEEWFAKSQMHTHADDDAFFG